MEVGDNNRSVMPFDVLDCTRVTIIYSTSVLFIEKRLLVLLIVSFLKTLLVTAG